MNPSRYIATHRSAVILAVLVLLSLASLVTGTEASFIQRGVVKGVTITTYPFLKAKRFAGDSVDYAVDFVLSYHGHRNDNRQLRVEIVRMKQALAQRRELQEENRRLRAMLGFTRDEPRLTVEPADVLESYKGMLRIDRGSIHGIKPSMCVLTKDGVVGLVTEVGPFTSVVATIHHRECRVGAMVQRNRLRAYDGVIHAGSDLSSLCTMEYIDMKEEVQAGDRVVTSPESLFPSGYPIGSITAVHGSGSLWKTAEVQPAVDPYLLDEVLIVYQAASDPELLAAVPERNTPISRAPELPDERSMQERFAP